MKREAPVQIAPDNPDIPKLLALIQQSFAFMEGRIDPPTSMRRLTVAQIQQQCMAGEVWAIGAPPVACVFLKPTGAHLYVGKLAVEASQRGQGLARRLIDLAEERARGLGLEALELETRIELVENHETFRRMGFEKVAEGKHDGFDRPTFVIMRLSI